MLTVPTFVTDTLTLHLVIDDTFLRDFWVRFKELAFDDATALRFPGPNPVSLEKATMGTLGSAPYFACEKTDGVRYALVCCAVPVDGRPENVCALMDRKLGVYLLPLRHVPTAMFQGSLLDGELVRNKASGRWEYVVFDAVCVSSVPVLNADLPTRMDAVHHVLRVYADDPEDPLRLRAKTFFSCARFAELEDALPRIREEYDVDGVVLTPARDPIVYGRHTTLFKLKFDARHTVDFFVGADGITLFVFDHGHGHGHGQKYAAVARARRPLTPRTVVECKRGDDGVWDMVMERTDKSGCNDMLTYRKTLVNMEENLGLEDLRRALSVSSNK